MKSTSSKWPWIRTAGAMLCAWALALGHSTARAADVQKPSGVDFSRDIEPILAGHCYACHGQDKAEGGLRLNNRAEAIKGVDSGERAIVPGRPEASELLRRVSTKDASERMPSQGEPLSESQIAALKTWIAAGATWESHWSLRPIEASAPPAVKRADWVRNPIDRFVLARLEQEGIPPSPEADPYTLVKRLYYDLLGLPPTPEEMNAYLADQAPDRYEKLVDRLLASGHFGERWGRHWLDMARYADSDGYEKDQPRPDAWRYRDWVIDAVNRDMPLDQFTIEQLAGDLLPNATPHQRLATAFHRQTLTNKEGGADQEQFRVEAVVDRVDTTGAVWLGLTVGCARCHSHKFDSISHSDYYRLFAFFNNADETTIDMPLARGGAAAKREVTSQPQSIDTVDDELPRADENPDQEKVAEDQPAVQETKKDKKKKKAKKKPRASAEAVRVLTERTRSRRASHILHRGDFLQPTERVQPGTPDVLPPLAARRPGAEPDRLDLAHWLMSEQNPLVARVMTNHVWMHLFGEGLVSTPNDFGVRGERPSHAALLDYLAAEYRRQGWSRKALVRSIVTSATYRQSSQFRPELKQRDPLNRLLARQNRFRVEAEIVRDVALSASGLLSAKIGGPSVFPPMPPDVAALSYANNFRWQTSQGEERYRRGMYTFFKRTAPHPDLTTFDCPDANTTTVQRNKSNTPLQALTTLNNEVFVEASQSLARRLLRAPHRSDDQRLAAASTICAMRPPSEDELRELSQLLEKSRRWYAQHPAAAALLAGKNWPSGVKNEEAAAWVATVRVALNLDTLLTRE